MFDRFRVRYPQGCLISELLTIENGNYVVRSLVQVEGVTLATGLATADQIEIAEDRARTRALAVLGIISTPETKEPESALVSPILTPQLSATVSGESVSPNDPSSLLPEAPPINTTPLPETQPLFSTPPGNAIADFTPQEVDIPVLKHHSPLDTPTFTPPKSEFESASQGLWSGSTAILEENLSREEMMARTGIETKRLGWTSEQGRDYLQATYGKKGRSQLTDRELREFLVYLEAQPTPSD